MTATARRMSSSRDEPTPDEDDPVWRLWGPYMSNREWGTVRQTDGPEGTNWDKFPFDRAASTAYRFGEDGIFGVCDQDCRICHAYAFWNYTDDKLKERLFGLTNRQGLFGEDVKETFYYQAADRQYRYVSAEYIYPQVSYPYEHLVRMDCQLKGLLSNASATTPEALMRDTSVSSAGGYFEIDFEMTKLAPNALYFQLGIKNTGSQTAKLVAMPMLFLRNTWSTTDGWPAVEDVGIEKFITAQEDNLLVSLTDLDGNTTCFSYHYSAEDNLWGKPPEVLLTHNETRTSTNSQGHFKDAFQRYIVNGDRSGLMRSQGARATKAGVCYRLKLEPQQKTCIATYLVIQQKPGTTTAPEQLNWSQLAETVDNARLDNLVRTYRLLPIGLTPAEQDVMFAAQTNLLWNRQFYPLELMHHLWNAPRQLPTQLVTVPDKWEQPYLATWDAALHCLCLSCFDMAQALKELNLLLALIRPDGSLYNDEYRPNGVTPPLLVLAAIDIYGKCSIDNKLIIGPKLYSCLLRHLTWWLKRKDAHGVTLLDGGICGMDYVTLFPRELVETGEGLIWAIFFAMRFLELTLAIYQTPGCPIKNLIAFDLPAIIRRLNRLCQVFKSSVARQGGLYFPYWLDTNAVRTNDDGTSNRSWSSGNSDSGIDWKGYDDVTNTNYNSRVSVSSVLSDDGSRGRAYCSFIPEPNPSPGDPRQRCPWLHAYCYLPAICCCCLPNIALPNASEDAPSPSLLTSGLFGGIAATQPPHVFTDANSPGVLFVSLLTSEELMGVLEQVLRKEQFLSPYGIRTMSMQHSTNIATANVTNEHHRQQKIHLEQPFCSGAPMGGAYGGNTNWYGGVNLPYNYLMIEALHKWSTVLGGRLDLIECPTYSGRYRQIREIVSTLVNRNIAIFLPRQNGIIPCTGEDGPRGLLLYETFDGETGLGHGASHKGGWTAIVMRLLLLMSDQSIVPYTGKDSSDRGPRVQETVADAPEAATETEAAQTETGAEQVTPHKEGWGAIVMRILLLMSDMG